MENKKLVIIGGGFGGLTLAKNLRNSNLDITLIDKTNHHLFQPLLYQVAAAALSPGDIAVPIRAELNGQKNVEVILGEVTNIDRVNKKVFTKEDTFDYDYLVIAIGNRHSYFGHNEWENYAPGLKTIRDALTIREKMLLAFEKAEKSFRNNTHRKEVNKYMTFIVVGGGPTGVEVAGAVAEIAKKSLLKDFRHINTADAKIILVEGMDRILLPYDEELSKKAKETLEKMGVEVILNSMVEEVTENGVKLKNKFIESTNVIWAAGNEVSSLLKTLNSETDKAGRVKVESDCSLPGDPNVFVIGDAALFIENGKPLPGVAPVAMQQGKYLSKILKSHISQDKREPFSYFDKGKLATIGRAKAIMQLGRFKLTGFSAWLVWALVHIAFLINFRKRYRVMTEWIWYYITFRNGIRLITKYH